MDWNLGFSSMYELRRVDPVSWTDMGSYDLTAGNINRSNSGLMESADITMTENPGECWLRVYLKAKQGESGARVPIFTGLAAAPQRTLNGNNETYKVECYSVLKPVDDILTPRGFFVSSGVPGAEAAAELLKVGAAPVTYDTMSPTLKEPIVSEDKDTNLSIAQKILDAINWIIRIGGDGSISIIPKPRTEVALFDEHENDSIEVSITDTSDWFSTPNCIRVISGEECVEIRDDDASDELSTSSRKANRGGSGEIWAQESASTISDSETLYGYAERRLKELQSYARTISYARRYSPDITVGDKVRLHLPGHGIDDVFTVKSQKIVIGYNARVTEEVSK